MSDTALDDSWATLKALVRSPLDGLAAEYLRLGSDRSLQVGGMLGALAALISAFATSAGVQSGLGIVGGRGDSASIFLQVFGRTLTITAAIAGLGFAARRIGNPLASVAEDIFTAGTAMLALSISMLIAAGLPPRAAGFVLLVGFAYFAVLLYLGLVKLGRVSARLAIIVAVAMILTASGIARAFSYL
jgi:hypothetical protein